MVHAPIAFIITRVMANTASLPAEEAMTADSADQTARPLLLPLMSTLPKR